MKRKGNSPAGKQEKDFPKKKQKLGKKKQEPDNATNISFKSKPVVLPSQLVPTSEPTTHRKVPLQTLLNQLGHFKASVRTDALLGLRSLFTEHPSLLVPHTDKLISQVLLTLTDSEPSVRSALILLLGDVFPKIPVESLKPFFAILEAHLSCGFTHIDDQIQLDTLKVFKPVLLHFPELLVSYASKQLPLLLNLVSRQPKRSNAVDAAAAGLTSKPSSKLALQSSRLEIFMLMSKYLEAACQARGLELHQPAGCCVDVANRKVLRRKNGAFEEVQCTVCDFSGPIPHVPLVQRYGIDIPVDAFLSSVSGSSSVHLLFPEREEFAEFSRSLFSLLIESWVESSGSPRSELPVAILNLLCLLLKAVRLVDLEQPDLVDPALDGGDSKALRRAFFEAHWSDFHKHILAGFPFSSETVSQAALLELNFSLCHCTLLLLLPSSGQPTQQQAAIPVLDTVVSICHYIGSVAEEGARAHVKTLVEILPMILKFKSLSTATLKKLLGSVWKVYCSTGLHSNSRQLLVQCFSSLHRDIFSREMNSRVILSELLSPWLQTLPSLLVKLAASPSQTVSTCVVVSMATAIIHGNPALTESLQENYGSILQRTLPVLPEWAQWKVVGLLWYLPRITTAVADSLLHCCTLYHTPSLASHTLQLVHQRLVGSTGEPTTPSSIAQYVSFILSTAMGYSKMFIEERMKCHPAAERPLLVLCEPLKPVSLAHRTTLLNTLAECVSSTAFLPDILTVLEPSLEELISGLSPSLPVDSAMGLLRLTVCCLSGPFPSLLSNKLLQLLSMLCLACLVALATGIPSAAASLVSVCGQLTNQVLGISRPLLCALLVQFRKKWTYDTDVYGPKLQDKVFGYFLGSALFTGALQDCKQEVDSIKRHLLMEDR